MCASTAPEWLDGFYLYSIYNSLSTIGQCLENMNILGPKIAALEMGSKKQL
jgi:hypothetical protein